MPFPAIIVEPLEGADELLRQDPDATMFRSVISISSHPTNNRPSGLDDTRRSVLYLTFDDVEHPEHGNIPPKAEDIYNILQFTKNNQNSRNILVHCHAGISRSTATAVIMHTFLLGRGKEQLALDMVATAITSRAIRPNPLMIKLADGIMDCDGKLIAVVHEFNSKVDGHAHSGYGLWW